MGAADEGGDDGAGGSGREHNDNESVRSDVSFNTRVTALTPRGRNMSGRSLTRGVVCDVHESSLARVLVCVKSRAEALAHTPFRPFFHTCPVPPSAGGAHRPDLETAL